VTDAPHERDLVVWDVPSAIDCGARFRIKIGAKCSGACEPDDWLVEIRDHEGGLVAMGTVGRAPWPASKGLYYREFELCAPDVPGQFPWEVALPAEQSDPGAHAAHSVPFTVRSVPEGDCRLKVIAIDRASQLPVAGLRVVVHPYRSVTDSEGVAELHLPAGHYRLFVSGKNFFPFRSDGTLSEDTTIRAELDPDRGPTDAERWS
jgi:hypothetical protein